MRSIGSCVRLAHLFTASVLLSSAASANAEARLIGLSSGQVSSFTTSPGGCALSLLFDDFRAPSSAKTANGSRHFAIASSAETRGRPVLVDIRGAMISAPGAALLIRAATQSLKFQPSTEEFEVRTKLRLSITGDTPIEVMLDFPTSPATPPAAGLITVDSIDIALPSCSTAGERG